MICRILVVGVCVKLDDAVGTANDTELCRTEETSIASREFWQLSAGDGYEILEAEDEAGDPGGEMSSS